MRKSLKTVAQFLCIASLLIGLSACNNEEESTPAAIDCSVQVGECLTNGNRQAYIMYKSDGALVTNSCFQSVQMAFQSDGKFTWTSDSDKRERCMDLIGFENFTGNWTLENNNQEIHITPAWFTNFGQTETVLKIISLDENELVAETPSQVGVSTIVWRRL
jgi:hypothetical protein